MPSKRVWLVDASIYIFRSWFTWSADTHVNQQGQPVNAVLGFIAFVDDLLSKENPHTIAFAFDESRDSLHRKVIFPDYKANRDPAPDNLKLQFQWCRRYVRALGMVEASSSYFEADDILATWATQAETFTVVTADKDLTQLIRQGDLWCDYPKQLSLDDKAIIKKFGVRPDQIADQLALAGDKVDNIPGVPGVGMATAAKLLRYFDTIDVMLESIDKIGKMKFRGAIQVQSLIEEYQSEIRQYKQITSVVCDVPDLVLDLTRKSVNKNELDQLFSELLIAEQSDLTP